MKRQNLTHSSLFCVALLLILSGCADSASQRLDGALPTDSRADSREPERDGALSPDTLDPEHDGQATQNTRLIKVLAFNIHARLNIPDHGQFQEIGEILAARRAAGDEPDFVLLQEVLSPWADQVQLHAEYPHVAEGPPPVGIKVLGSGLMTLSKYPILQERQMAFEACADVNCFANKGVLATMVQPTGMPTPIMIVNTHMQAQEEFDEARILQMDEAAAFLQVLGYRNIASVFAGDFNTKPNRPSYAHFLSITPYTDAGKFCLDTPEVCTILIGENTNEGDVWEGTNDGHYYHAPATSGYTIVPVFLTRNFSEKGDDYYSDHWGYEVHYRITW